MPNERHGRIEVGSEAAIPAASPAEHEVVAALFAALADPRHLRAMARGSDAPLARSLGLIAYGRGEGDGEHTSKNRNPAGHDLSSYN
jgi:hypothetical protein